MGREKKDRLSQGEGGCPVSVSYLSGIRPTPST